MVTWKHYYHPHLSKIFCVLHIDMTTMLISSQYCRHGRNLIFKSFFYFMLAKCKRYPNTCSVLCSLKKDACSCSVHLQSRITAYVFKKVIFISWCCLRFFVYIENFIVYIVVNIINNLNNKIVTCMYKNQKSLLFSRHSQYSLE